MTGSISTKISDFWEVLPTAMVGGLTEIGFAEDERYLLVVSHNGRGLIDAETGTRIARDKNEPRSDSSWINKTDYTVEGIGPVQGQFIKMVGLWGNDFQKYSAYDEIVKLDSKDSSESVVLIDKKRNKEFEICNLVTEIRAFGFSKSEKYLVIASSSEIKIFKRKR